MLHRDNAYRQFPKQAQHFVLEINIEVIRRFIEQRTIRILRNSASNRCALAKFLSLNLGCLSSECFGF